MRQPYDEQQRWKAEAERLGITLTDYIRAKVNSSELKVARVTDPALFREVRRAGINLNQLAHGQNAGWTIGSRRYEDALDLFMAVYRRMLREYD